MSLSWRIGAVVAALAAVAAAEGARAEGEGGGTNQTHWTHDGSGGRGLPAVSEDRLRVTPADSTEWLHYGGNYASWRHSPMTSFTADRVSDLQMAWAFQTGIQGQLEANPLIYDGRMYLTSARNRLFALDAKSGSLLWRYDHPLPKDLRLCCGPANRGAAIGGDTLVMATLDARLVAFDRKTGALLWNSEIAPYADGFSATSAPLVVGELAVIGVGGGEYGGRCFIDAYDIKTGKRVWRHYTVPAAGEPGAETWAGNSNETGGASTWATGSYDPETGTLYWPVGNPSPDFNGDVRKGDNLYSDSILALDAKSGERKWYFQTTPHDVWDYDGNSELWLVDLEWEGAPRKGLVQANRNGYFYLLDRTSGEFLRATQYVDQLNWAKGIDAKGRPIVDPAFMPPPAGSEIRVCPGIAGGNNASYAGSFSPVTRLVYVASIESCSHVEKGAAVFVKGLPFFGGDFGSPDRDAGKAYGNILAIDVDSGEVRWRHREDLPVMAGTLSTAGGVVFSGNSRGEALALDANNGRVLWRFPTGSGIRSQPVVYEVDGVSYLAVGSGGGGLVSEIVGIPNLPHGSALFVFKLPGS